MLFKRLLYFAVRHSARGSKRPIHFLKVIVKRLPQVDPHYRVLPVEYLGSAGECVGIFEVVAEHQSALVVRADGCIKVIGEPAPRVVIIERGECVLGAGVHHEEQFREQVVEHGGVFVEMVFQLRLKFCQSICGVVNVMCIAVHINIRSGERIARGLALVCGYKPRRQGRKVGGVGVAVGVSSLKVIQPVIPAEIIGLPKDTGRRVVQDFPALIALGESEDLFSTLIVVEVVLSDERDALSVIPKDDDGEAVDALTDAGVGRLRRRPVNARVIVQASQFHVVRTLGGSYVRFERERLRGNGRGPHLVLGHRFPGGQHLESAVEFDFVVLPRIILGRCTLNVSLRIAEIERVCSVLRVDVITRNGLLISLVLGQFSAGDYHVRKVGRQVVDGDSSVLIVHTVMLIPFEH